MGFIIKDLQELTLEMFEGFGTDKEEETAQRLEAAERENDLIFWHYMKLLKKGVYDVIQTTDNNTPLYDLYTAGQYKTITY